MFRACPSRACPFCACPFRAFLSRACPFRACPFRTCPFRVSVSCLYVPCVSVAFPSRPCTFRVLPRPSMRVAHCLPSHSDRTSCLMFKLIVTSALTREGCFSPMLGLETWNIQQDTNQNNDKRRVQATRNATDHAMAVCNSSFQS